jgi:glycyl-tRNA synthetase alpha chain
MKLLNITEIIDFLYNFWSQYGCIKISSFNFPIGAGTFHPTCFFSALSSEKNSYMYLQRCERKADGRYGESPNRLIMHHQFQVFLKDAPLDIKNITLDCLEQLGLSKKSNEIRFNDNNWESISLGAIGVGWDISCNLMEVAQFTYFQKIGDCNLEKFFPVEIAFGLERLAVAIWLKNIYEIEWSHNVLYKDLFLENEKQMSDYYFNFCVIDQSMFTAHYEEALELLKNNLYLPAYLMLLKMNDVFNCLDARKRLTEFSRKNFINQMRNIAFKTAQTYLSMNTDIV